MSASLRSLTAMMKGEDLVMRVSFSPDVEAFYLSVREGKVAKTVDVTDLIAADLDADGQLIGVEFVMRPEKLTEAMYGRLMSRFPELDRTNVRASVAERVIAAMRFPVGRDPLAEPGPRGTVDVVIGMRDDTVQEAADAVSALGGRATVVVPHGPRLTPLQWTLHSGDGALALPPESNVHPDSTLGMLLDYLETASAGQAELKFSFRITVSNFEEAEVIEAGPLLALA